MKETPDTLLSYSIASDVMAFSTRRQGGISTGQYSSFNINDYCGDAPEAVAHNRQLLCGWLGIPADHLVMPHQTHGIVVREISEPYFAMDTSSRRQYLEGVDALITRMSGVCIGVSTADCIPVILYDPKHHACGVAHAGWRGTVARIVERTLADMHTVYSTSPQHVRAVIGPGISLQAFEVGQEVYDAFAKAGFHMEDIAKRYEKWHIDLPHCNQLQLIHCGVPKEQIQSVPLCTYHHSETFFSARRLGIHSGRIFTGAMIV